MKRHQLNLWNFGVEKTTIYYGKEMHITKACAYHQSQGIDWKAFFERKSPCHIAETHESDSWSI